MPATPWGPYPWDPGGAWDTSAPQPAAAPTPPDTSGRQKVIDDLIAQHGSLQGLPTTVYDKPTAAQTNAATTQQQRDDLRAQMNSGFDGYTFADGTTIELSSDGQSRNLKAASAAASAANNPTPVTANTTDPYIVMRDPKTGQTSTVANPNYKTPSPTSVTANTTDKFIVTRNADGTTKTEPNPNYKEPTPTSVSSNTTDQFIVTRSADGTTKTEPNPNYKPPVGTSVSTNTTDQFIVTRNPDGTTSNAPNPNYQPAAAAPISANTTDPYIVMRDPKSGNTTTVANPNYQKPAPSVVGSPSANDQFILSKDPTTGAVSPQANPNYVPPKPTQITPSTTAPFITTEDAKGGLTSIPNPSYTPTDPGRMTVQLQQQASQKQQDLQQQVTAGKMTSDQAASQFDQWWTQNIDPVKGDIAAAQAKAQGALDLQNAQTQNYQMTTAMQPATLAETASNNAQSRVVSMLPYVVGASAATTPGITTGKGGFPQINPQQIMQNATYSLPNLQEIGRQGAAAALAHISPTAQMHAQTPGPPGQPPVPGMPSPTDLLNQTAYGFGPPGGGAPAGAGGAAAAPGSNYNPNDIQWNQQANPASQPGRVVGPGGVIFNAQGQPEGTPPGMTPGLGNPAYQPLYPQAPAVGMPATGPVVGAIRPYGAGAGDLMSPEQLAQLGGTPNQDPNFTSWSWPPYQPSS